MIPDEVQALPSDAPPASPDGRYSDRLVRPTRRPLVPDTHPLGAGVLGRSGTPVASWLMNESDLLLVVGASFSHHAGIAPYKPIVQIDDSPTSIGRFDAVTANVLGDAAVVFGALTRAVTEADPEDQRTDVAKRWAIWRAEKAEECVAVGQPSPPS